MVDKPIPWITFAPLDPRWVIPSTIILPYQFSDAVSICALPSWILEDDTSDALRPQLRDEIHSTEPNCIQIQYQASALSTEQRDAARQIFSLHLALWMARRTPLSFDVIAHAEHYGRQWITRHIVSYDPARPLAEYQGESFSAEDFEQAKHLFLKMMAGLPKEGTIRTALATTTRALVEGSWELRYLLYWLAMESLFGPEDGREISFRLSQRVALFLEIEATKAQEVFKQVRAGYGWRSKIVHGLRVSKLNDGEAEKMLNEIEELLRRVIVLILSEDTTAQIFDGKGREEFLDGLAFR
jgi:hypothetical protein